MRQTRHAPVDEARKSLLLNVIENYIPLGPAEEAEFRQLVGHQELQEINEMLTIYEERGIVKGKQDATLRVMRGKFGNLPDAVVARVEAMKREDELNPLLDRLGTASSLDEMGIDAH